MTDEILIDHAYLNNEALTERGEFRIMGSGGGGGGKGKGSGKDANNTLRSKARARMIEAISEGEIEGLVNGERSIYFEQTPLRNEDGSYNFENVIWTEHKGLPDEGHFPGHSGVETPFSVEVEVKQALGPTQRTIVDENADAVRLIMRIPALFYQNKKKGETQTASISYRIDVRAYNGAWTTAIQKDIKNEKCTSPYQIAHRVELPIGGSPWDIRVVRLTADSNVDELQNSIWWESYVTIVDGKFTYPHTAAVGLEVNGEDMGSSIPARSFHVKGLKILVPSNYDPITRAYTGIWDGTFKRAWTNNPAWVFYDLITNDRYGLGEFIRPEIVDKWSLYTIAQYCDQLVPSGYRNGDTGEEIYEPRFTYNGVINNREEAYHVLQAVTTAWRGMAYWSLGQVFATADIPADPVKIVTPANVIGGEFNYSGTAMKSRHSVCLIKWNDPDDFYRPSTEIVINDAMLRRYGWREKSVTFEGCATRGLAHRYGKWILDIEQNETETVEYSASWDHAEVRPGDIVAIADPAKAQVRFGGRMVSYDPATRVVKLDGNFEATPGEVYSIMMAMPDGKLETRSVVAWNSQSEPVVTTAFSQVPEPDAMYAITGTDIRPRQFRVLSVREEEKNKFKVTALFHDPNKYARVEQNIVFDPLPYSRPKNVSYPPENLAVREIHFVNGGVQQSRMLFSWTPNPNFLSKSFRVKVVTPYDGELNLGETESTWVELNNAVAGPYTFMVQSVSLTGMLSTWVELDYEATGPEGIPIPTVTNLRLADGGTTFAGRDVRILWDNNFASSSDPTADDGVRTSAPSTLYRNNTVKVYDTATNTLLREQNVTSASYTYSYEMNVADSVAAGFTTPRRNLRFEVTVTDTFDRTSAPVSQVFSNPPPAQLNLDVDNYDALITIKWPPSSDLDIAGTLIWIEQTSGFDPLTTTPIGDTGDTSYSLKALSNTVYYIRAASYDAFGKDGLNYTSEYEVSTSVGYDMDPPGTPTGLTLTSAMNDADTVTLTATWDENPEPDVAFYDIALKEDTGNEVSFRTGGTIYSWNVLPGRPFHARVRAGDTSANTSDYTAVVSHTTVVDTVPPADPTELTASAGLDAIWLTWDDGTEIDLDHYEIYEGETDDENAATLIGKSASASIARTGLALATTRYYWVKAVDTSGNKSGFSNEASATTGSMPDSEQMTVEGITLSAGVEAANRLRWTEGSISYGAPGATPTVKAITTNFADWTSGTLYVYYTRGANVLSVTSSLTVAYAVGNTLIGVYKGGSDFQLGLAKTLINGANILTGSIGAAQLTTTSAVITGTAQIADAIISSAKIISLSAAQIQAGTALANTITVAGTSLGTINSNAALGAQDPVSRINAGLTRIDPGRITISGSTTLDSWRGTSDTTTINGGKIETDSITVRSLKVGNTANMIDNGWSEGTLEGWNSAGFLGFYQEISGCPLAGQWIAASNARDQFVSRIYECSPGESFYASTWVCNTYAENNANLYLFFRDSSGAVISYMVIAATSAKSWVKIEGIGTAPANAVGVQVCLQTDRTATGGNVTWWGRPTMTRAAGGEMIVDGAITAIKIGANQVTATHLSAASVTADKMAIGVGGNLLRNTEFSGEWKDWNLWNQNNRPNRGFDLRPSGDVLCLAGQRYTAYMYQLDAVNYGSVMHTAQGNIAARPGQRYEAYAYLGTHRCVGRVIMAFKNANGDYLAEFWSPEINASVGGRSIADWHRAGVFAVAPANTALVEITIRKYETIAGSSDSYLFFARPYLGEALSNQTEFTSWSSGGFTTITGAYIDTGTITADKLTVTTLSAISANLGSITAGSININNRFIVGNDGSVTIRSGTSGARLEISNQLVTVYDGAGTLRVRLGIW